MLTCCSRLGCSCLFEAHLQLHVIARHVRGRDKSLADDLSRNRLQSFFFQDPRMMPQPSPLLLLILGLGELDTELLFPRHCLVYPEDLRLSTEAVSRVCHRYRVSNPFPVSESLLCYYVAFLAQEGLAPLSIKRYLAAVRHLQILLGYPDKNKALQQQASRPRLPITGGGYFRP